MSRADRERLAPKRRHQPYVGQTVNIRWNSGNDNHADEHIEGGMVISAGETTLWVHAPEAGVKVEQDVLIKYDQIVLIQEVSA